ncbi:O-antigen ligase family protein [Bacillus salipaludis]|uniref:O-antigen ligase family protein n=1 Tax=Bacillus salipaludis TaxID=2547811 RepID=UPI003D191960
MIYPWGYDPYYTLPKVVYLDIFVLATWLYIILKRKYRTLNLTKSYLKAEFIILLFLSLIVISTMFSVDLKTSLYGTKNRYAGALSIFCYCSVFLFSYRFMDSKKLEKIIPGMAIVSIPVSIYGILQHYSLDFLPRNSGKMGELRSYSFFDNPNFFGSYLVLILLLTITLYINANSKKMVTFYFSILCIAFVALIFSGTRSGWVGVFCGMLFLTVFVILKRKFLWKKWAIIVLTFGFIFFTLNMIEKGNFLNRISSGVTDSYNIVTDQSTGMEGSSRLYIWKKALPLVKTYFWIGSGPDTFAKVFPYNQEEYLKYFGDPNVTVDKAHNVYLQMAITVGVPALIVYFSIIVFVLRQAFRAIKQAVGKEKIYIYGLVSTILGYLVQAFFNISVVPVAPLFRAVLGITLAKSSVYLKSKSSNTENFNQSA